MRRTYELPRVVVLGFIVAAVAVVTVSVIRLATANASASVLSAAATDVADRVDYAEKSLAAAHVYLPHSYLVSLAAMSYVVGQVSAPQYGYLHEIAHKRVPTTAAEALDEKAGICGNATDAMLAILTRLHIESRRVDIYYSTPRAPSNGHSTVEVRYRGAWHWFDPTWGAIYVDPKEPQWKVLSLVDVLKLTPAQREADRIADDARLWPRVVRAAGRSLGIETGMLLATLPHLRVQVDGRTTYRR